jgi:hypothetical protein
LASQINASNSGFGGIVSTGDSSGELQLQTAGTTALTIDTSQRAAFVAGTAAAPAITTTGDTNTGIFFPAADTIAFAEGGAESMRIDSSGNVGIGTASPSQKLQISTSSASDIAMQLTNSLGSFKISNFSDSSIGLETTYSAPIRFFTNATERMRISSTGNVMVGTTIEDGKFSVTGGTGSSYPTIYIKNNNNTSGDYCAQFAMQSNNTNNTSSFYLNCTIPGIANKFAIYGNGTYGTLSDQRLKKNIETARDGYLDDVNKLRVVKYNWNSQEDGEAKELGVIAQELEQVFPGLIQESKAEGADTSYKQIKTSVLPFILLKAIQEQQTIINDLKARVEALEAK